MSQDRLDSQAITPVALSGMKHTGCYSLQATVQLEGGHKNNSRGEAYVDMRHFPPTGIEVPVNLEGQTIIVWFYVPAAAAGDPINPNGVQLFVKDRDSRREYGTWFNLINNTDEWIPVGLTPSRVTPPGGGHMDPGFDPGNIIVVGIKIGAGAGSAAIYSGSI